MQYPDAKLLIFAKAPVAGQVKTRLEPALGSMGALALYQELLDRVVTRFGTADLCRVECWCAPDIDHPVFQQLSTDYPIQLKQQQGRDLGERMGHAAKCALSESDSVLLMGTDCPLLDVPHIRQGLQWLASDRDAVIGPAEDGGYVLLGLRRYHPDLFRSIAWGGGDVLSSTRERMRALEWQWSELETLWDLDRPEDLARYRAL